MRRGEEMRRIAHLHVDEVAEPGEVGVEVGDGVELHRDVPDCQHAPAAPPGVAAPAPPPPTPSPYSLEVEPLGGRLGEAWGRRGEDER